MAVDINYLAVLVSALIAFALGALWYGPLFGKLWMNLMNINPKAMKNPDNKKKAMRGYLIMFIALLIMAYVMAHIIKYTGANSIGEGIQTGLFIWLGFLATTMIGSFLWEEKPLALYVLNVGHYLLVLGVMGALLAVWN